MFLEMGTVMAIIKGISWINSFGDAEIKHVKKETEELLIDLSKSLMNLFDVTEKITQLSNKLPQLSNRPFVKEFEQVNQYCRRFYFDQSAISAARTHCGDVERDVERIKFKLGTFLRTDIGKWSEADEKLKLIVDNDGLLLTDYDESVRKLSRAMYDIGELLKNKKYAEAKNKYLELGKSLEDDLQKLKDGVEQMRQAANHIRGIVS